MNEIIRNINILLGSLVTKSNTQLRELHSLSEELFCLKDSVRSLNDSMTGLKVSMASLNHLEINVNDQMVGLNDSVRSLREQLTEHKQQTATTDTITQQMNTKLNTLISDLSQHQQQTAAESAQFQTSFTQLHYYQTNNLTHQLETIHSHVSRLHGPYTCAGTTGWRRVVYLDMTDPSTTCPSGWQLTGLSKRTCGKVSTQNLACDSVTFPVSGGEYSRVCGRIKAYQYGPIDAFEAYNDGLVTTIDGAYVAGVSLTHGSPRRHIWTFAAGISEVEPTRSNGDQCPCDASITIRVPPFMGDDYFCESGVNAGYWGGFHPDDPLWDGQNCTSSSTCCSFNTPPYFVKQLPTSTTDSIEARLCLMDGEDSPVEFIELYVQ